MSYERHAIEADALQPARTRWIVATRNVSRNVFVIALLCASIPYAVSLQRERQAEQDKLSLQVEQTAGDVKAQSILVYVMPENRDMAVQGSLPYASSQQLNQSIKDRLHKLSAKVGNSQKNSWLSKFLSIYINAIPFLVATYLFLTSIRRRRVKRDAE